MADGRKIFRYTSGSRSRKRSTAAANTDRVPNKGLRPVPAEFKTPRGNAADFAKAARRGEVQTARSGAALIPTFRRGNAVGRTARGACCLDRKEFSKQPECIDQVPRKDHSFVGQPPRAYLAAEDRVEVIPLLPEKFPKLG